jgi:site-specific DNA recombinase
VIWSGRPIFNQALDLLKAGAADGSIAAKLDRVARNTLDVLELFRDVLQPLDKALILLDLNVDTSTPTGKMVLTVMSGVAELERALITRTQTGRKNKAAKGGYAYGSPAFGMMSDENNELTLNLDEQEAIEIIRKHRKSGKSFDQIAQHLNGQGIQTKRGGMWLGRTVYNVYQKIEVK